MNRPAIAALAALSLLAFASPAGTAPHSPIPVFDSTNFHGAPIDNHFSPFKPGAHWAYRSQTATGVETSTTDVAFETRTVDGVIATIVHDVVKLDGGLIEDTFDWFAQDDAGNVWYLGEDTKEYDGHGGFIGTAGSWEGGVSGAVPGILMLADPQKGDSYPQEFAAGIAEDQARVTSLGGSVTVPYGSFSDVLETLEWTPLEPGARERKLYAPNVGLLLTEGKKERVELVEASGL